MILLIFLSFCSDSILVLSIDSKKTLLDGRYLISSINTFAPETIAEIVERPSLSRQLSLPNTYSFF